ncbi:MAG: hypothetical protein ABI461_14045 [Polyangiaceae bacterium]
MRRFFVCAFPFAIALAACVPPQEDPNAISPSNPQPMPPSSSLVSNSDATPTEVPPPASSPHDTSTTPLTVEIHSDCTDSVPLFLGEKPKFGSGTKTSISSNSTTSFPRDSDGTLTVWIIDEQENGLASVKVSKRMKRIDIGRSCRTMDAH